MCGVYNRSPTNSAGGDTPEEPTCAANYPALNGEVDYTENRTRLPGTTQKRSLSLVGPQHQTNSEEQAKKKFKPRSKIPENDLNARESNSLSEPVARNCESENEWEIYGRHVVAQLKRLSPVQAITAQMEINNVLTKCRLNDVYGTTTAADRLLSVATNVCHPSTGSSHVCATSPKIE